jgi:hypothetical protein
MAEATTEGIAGSRRLVVAYFEQLPEPLEPLTGVGSLSNQPLTMVGLRRSAYVLMQEQLDEACGGHPAACGGHPARGFARGALVRKSDIRGLSSRIVSATRLNCSRNSCCGAPRAPDRRDCAAGIRRSAAPRQTCPSTPINRSSAPFRLRLPWLVPVRRSSSAFLRGGLVRCRSPAAGARRFGRRSTRREVQTPQTAHRGG